MTSPRVVLYAVLAALVLGAVGFLAGRYTATPRVEVKVQEVERIKTVVVKGEDRVVVRRVVVEKKPDGTTTTTTDERESTKTAERTETTERTDRKVETKPVQPQWRASALVGVTPQLVPVYGAVVERRIVGPVHAGVWAIGGATWAGGVSVGVVW